jgi:alkylhydroperoxidase family enzyme
MDQLSLCLFLAMKRLSAQAIDNELVAVPVSDAIGCSMVTNNLRQRHFPSALREAPDEPLHGIPRDFP